MKVKKYNNGGELSKRLKDTARKAAAGKAITKTAPDSPRMKEFEEKRQKRKSKLKMERGGKTKKKRPNKTKIFLKGLDALSSKQEPDLTFAQIKPKDTGKKKRGSKSVPQNMAKGGLTKKQSADFKMMKKGGMAGLSGPQKEVYRRGLAAYMSSGNRPKVSQHAWAMARVKSAFGKREAAKIAAGKGKNNKKK